MITADRLKEFINYNPDTGSFVWAKNKARAVKGGCVGSIASNGYLMIKLDQERHLASRLAWLYCYGSFPSNYIDHINGDILDNRICNLRDVTAHDNARNRKIFTTNTSGICGVGWCKKWKKWVARINKNKVNVIIGGFDTIFDAACARKSKEIELGYHENHGKR